MFEAKLLWFFVQKEPEKTSMIENEKKFNLLLRSAGDFKPVA